MIENHKPMRVLIVGDHKILCQGLRSLLQERPDVEAVMEASDDSEPERLVVEHSPSLVIMALVSPAWKNAVLTRRILARNPDIKIIVLSMHSDKRLVTETMAAGASGYLLEGCGFEELDVAIHTVADGRTYVTPRIAGIKKADRYEFGVLPCSPLSALTSKEYEVLQLLAQGNSNREIAEYMLVSIKTVQSHRQQIMKKLEIHNIPDLNRYVRREGLVSADPWHCCQ